MDRDEPAEAAGRLFDWWDWTLFVLIPAAAGFSIVFQHRNPVWVGFKVLVVLGWLAFGAYRTRRGILRRREDERLLAEARARRDASRAT